VRAPGAPALPAPAPLAALARPPSLFGQPLGLGAFVEIKVPYLQSDFELLWTRMDIYFQRPEGIVPLTLVGFFRFNCEGQIASFDLNALNLQRLNDPPVESQPLVTGFLCNGIMATCGEYPQFDSVDKCIEVMSGIPFGSSSNLLSNTVSCRSLYLALAQFRPQTHCPSLGELGGDKCVQTPYMEYYRPEKFF
jgi:hypothetical protein